MKKILVVMNLNMKRLDSWIEFNRSFVSEAAGRGYVVEYLLPCAPCVEVMDYFEVSGFRAFIFSGWNSAPEQQNDLALARECFNRQRTGRYDLVAFHFCNEKAVLAFVALTALTFCKPKIVWHQHSDIQRVGRASLKAFLSQLRLLSLVIDRVCPVYEGMRQILIDRLIAPAKIRVLSNGVNPSHYQSLRPGAGQLLKSLTGSDNVKIITIGSLIHRKGMDIFLKAARNVLAKQIATDFIIVGEGPLREELGSLARDLGIEKNVFFMGKRSDVALLLQEADVFVLASRAEPFGLVNIEAMSAGKPVVASAVGGIPEIIENGKSGFLVPAEDISGFTSALLRLVEDKPLRDALGQRGRAIVESRFTLTKMVNAYYTLYSGLLK